MSRILFIACLLLVCMFSSMHVTNALWQQRKVDEFRRNNINLNVKHQDWSVKGNPVGYFADFKSSLVIDEKAAVAFAATSNSSDTFLLQIDLTTGQQKVTTLSFIGGSVPVGAVLDDNGHYYLLSTPFDEDDVTTFDQINTKTGQTFSRRLPEFGKAHSISLTTDDSILVTSRKMIGSFRTDTFYENWIVQLENEYLGVVTSLLVNKEKNNEDMLYVLTLDGLTKYRVKDGKLIGRVPFNLKSTPQTLVYLGEPNLIGVTSTNVNMGGLSYLSIINFETRQVYTSEIITNPSGVFPGPAGCDFPTYFGKNPNFKLDKYDIFVSCENYKGNTFNIYTSTAILNFNSTVINVEVNGKELDILKGATLIPNTDTFISKKNYWVGGDYIITDVKGNVLSTIKSSNFKGEDSCEIITSTANNRFYAFCRVGPNDNAISAESRSFAK